jgi:hypothetical protein
MTSQLNTRGFDLTAVLPQEALTEVAVTRRIVRGPPADWTDAQRKLARYYDAAPLHLRRFWENMTRDDGRVACTRWT